DDQRPAWVDRRHGQVRLDGGAQFLRAGAGFRDRGLDGEKTLDAKLDDLVQQSFLAADMRVEAAWEHADFAGDVTHRGPGVAALAKQLHSGFQDLRPWFLHFRTFTHESESHVLHDDTFA